MVLRMVISGGRNFNDRKRLFSAAMFQIQTAITANGRAFDKIEIITGGSEGADALGKSFAENYQYKSVEVIPDWDAEGKFAGYNRNETMAKYAIGIKNGATELLRKDVRAVLCTFWDGRSRATKNMISFAHMYEFDTIHIELYPVEKDE